MAEYVDGRQMRFSSSDLTSDASLNRGGGSVKCCLGSTDFLSSSSSCARRGKIGRAFAALPLVGAASAAPLVGAVSSWPSSYTAVKPANLSTLPLARKVYLPALMSTVVWSKMAAAICDAIKRSQIN